MDESFLYRRFEGLDLSGNPVWREVETSPEMRANIRRTRQQEAEITRLRDQYFIPSRPDFMPNDEYLDLLSGYSRLINQIYRRNNLADVNAEVLARAYGRAYNPLIGVVNRATSENDRLLYNTILRNERLMSVMPELRQQTEALPTSLRTNIANLVVPRINPQQYETLFNQDYNPRSEIKNPVPSRHNTPR